MNLLCPVVFGPTIIALILDKCLDDEGPFYAADIVLYVLNYTDIVYSEFDSFVFVYYLSSYLF